MLGKGFRFLLWVAAFVWVLAAGEAQAQGNREYQLKAVYLYNFIQFVEWPPTAFKDAGEPIRIGILGTNPFGRLLEDTVRSETVRNRKVVIQRGQQLSELKDCHMVFIARSEKERIGEIVSTLASAPVLTVSEVDGFVKDGGIINFYLEGNKVRFELNPPVAQRRGLKVSSELLVLGKVSGSGTPPQKR